MKIHIGKTTFVGLGAIAAGILGKKIGLDPGTQAQLITGGAVAVVGRDTLGKILGELQKLNGGKG